MADGTVIFRNNPPVFTGNGLPVTAASIQGHLPDQSLQLVTRDEYTGPRRISASARSSGLGRAWTAIKVFLKKLVQKVGLASPPHAPIGRPRLPAATNRGYNGWIPLSDLVAFFETVKTHNLNKIRAQYGQMAQNGFNRGLIYDVLTRQFNVAAAQLEHDIGHQNPNPNRSITEITSNAVDAMNGRHTGDVNVTLQNGRYTVEDSGTGMSVEEVFEKLLIPQISGKSGEVTIGRFGIGFYTALVHLRNQKSRVIVETKREGHEAVRLEFIRLNGELGVSIGPSNKTTHGTTIRVTDKGIDENRMFEELSSHMGYVLNRRIMVNGNLLNMLDPSRIRQVGNGSLYVSEETGLQGKVVITVGGVRIEEFATQGPAVPELMVFDFPLSTKLPESRNQIRVDQTVVNQVWAFIDAVADIEDNQNKIAFLNGIAPMIVELQRRNEMTERMSDLVEHAKFVAGRYLQGNVPVPDEPAYNAVIQSDIIGVNDLYLRRDWHELFDKPPEWRGSAKLLLTDIALIATSGIIYDEKHDVILLDRTLYEMHKSDPAGLEALTNLLPKEARGSWDWSPVSAAQQLPKTEAVQSTPPVEAPQLPEHVEAPSSPSLSPVVEGMIAEYPILIGQLEALTELETRDPEVLDLLSRLPSAEIPHIGIHVSSHDSVVAMGTREHRLFNMLNGEGHDDPTEIIRADGTPFFEGSTWRVREHNDGQVIKFETIGTTYFFRADGRPLIETHNGYYYQVYNQYIVASSRWPLFGDKIKVFDWDGKMILEGNNAQMQVGPDGSNSVIITDHNNRKRIITSKSGLSPAYFPGDVEHIEERINEDGFNYIIAGNHLGNRRAFKWDGTPIIEGSYFDIHVYGKNGQYILIRRDIENHFRTELLRADGRSIAHNVWNVRTFGKESHFIAIEQGSGTWRLLESNGTWALEDSWGTWGDVNLLGNEYQILAVRGWGQEESKVIIQRKGKPILEDPHLQGVLNGEFDGFRRTWQGLDDDWRIYETEDLLVIEGQFEDIKVYGENDQYIAIRKRNSDWEIFTPDGKRFFSLGFRSEKIVRGLVPLWSHVFEGRMPPIEKQVKEIKELDKNGKYVAAYVEKVGWFIEPGPYDYEFYDEKRRNISLKEATDSYIVLEGDDVVSYHTYQWPDKVVDAVWDAVRGNRRHGIYTRIDKGRSLLMTSLDLSVFSSPDVRTNLERLVKSDLDDFQKQVALSLISFPEDLFNFAITILPHTKMDMRFAQNLIKILIVLADKHSAEILGALCDIALASRWGDSPPEYASEKLQVLADHLERTAIIDFRDLLVDDREIRSDIQKGELDALTSLPPRMRGYAYYLAMDTAELLPAGVSLIPEVTTSQSFSLIDLNTAVRSHRVRWQAFDGNVRQAVRAIQRQTAGTDREVSANRIRHAMYHLGDGQSLLFLRELIQNSLDAIRGNEGTSGTVNVESFEENGAHVLRIIDPVGMSFNDALNNLFIFGESTKGEEDLGKFGVGFFTIYPGSSEVRIKTGTGDGKVAIFTLKPVYEGETVVDITMSYVVRDENFKGTVIERVSNSEIPALDAAMARSSTLSYGRFLDASEIGVEYNGKQVNLEMKPIAQQDVAGMGAVRIYEAAENAFTVGGLYVKNISSSFYENLPPAIRALVAPTGIVIDLPGSTPLVRSRNDFVDPINLEGKLLPAVHAMLLKNYLEGVARGEVDISGLPEVYFISLYSFAEEDRIPQQIRFDAGQLLYGQGLPEVERYLDERSFLQLLTLVPCLKIGEETVSIYDLLLRVKNGEQVDTSALPSAINERIKKAAESRQRRAENKAMMDNVAQELSTAPEQAQALPDASAGGRELTLSDWKEDILHRHWTRTDATSDQASAYDAFLLLVDRIMGRAGSNGHTIGLSSFLERNALADHRVRNGQIEMYFSLTAAEKYAQKLQKILSAEQYPASRMQSLMAELIDDVTHEMTHDLLETADEWTHDPEFYRRQQQIVTRLLRAGPLQLENLWSELKAQYPNPTFMSAKEFLKLLITGRRENPSGTAPQATPTPQPPPLTPSSGPAASAQAAPDSVPETAVVAAQAVSDITYVNQFPAGALNYMATVPAMAVNPVLMAPAIMPMPVMMPQMVPVF